MSTLTLPGSESATLVDDRIRGFPAGHEPLPLNEIGHQGWKPRDGAMALPLITLDHDAFHQNAELMMRYVAAHGIAIAPHAKTPMSIILAARLADAGAWGATVADIRQMSVMLKAGFSRLILANEIGGNAAARRLAAVLSRYPHAEIHIFVDSCELVEALRRAWSERDDLPTLGMLIEVGAARAGARTFEEADRILGAAVAAEASGLFVSGVASYEGAAATADPEETVERIEGLVALTAQVYRRVRARLGPNRGLIVTAGGSVYFDLVVAGLKPAIAGDDAATLMLRSGAVFFHDHGVYERGLSALDERSGLAIDGQILSASRGFKPALRVWAEVLSRPEKALAVVGMGLRDVAVDQGLPRPLVAYRDGAFLRELTSAEVTKLNDQHAFVGLGASEDLRIGDVIAFGLSHPCTCLDRHAVLYELDTGGTVIAALATSFG